MRHLPAVKHTSIRTLLSRAAMSHIQADHLDLKTRFLDEEIKEVIYMEQPPVFEEFKCASFKIAFMLRS